MPKSSDDGPQSAIVPALVASEGVRFDDLGEEVRKFVAKYEEVCTPEKVYVCNGSDQENDWLCSLMKSKGMLRRVTHPTFSNW